MAHPHRSEPPTVTAAALRAASDLIGVIPLADRLDVAQRTLYNWMQGKRTPPPAILGEVHTILVKHRQQVGTLIQAIRAIEDGRIADSTDVSEIIHRHECEDIAQEADQ